MTAGSTFFTECVDSIILSHQNMTKISPWSFWNFSSRKEGEGYLLALAWSKDQAKQKGRQMECPWVKSEESSTWRAQLSHSERGSNSKRLKIKLDYLGNVLGLHLKCLENVFSVYLIQISYTRFKNVWDTRFQNGFEILKCPRSVNSTTPIVLIEILDWRPTWSGNGSGNMSADILSSQQKTLPIWTRWKL